VAAFFVAGQPDVPYVFFTKYLTNPAFIRKNIFSYLRKIFLHVDPRSTLIPDFIDTRYVVDVACASPDCQLDIPAFRTSDIDLFVRVVDIESGLCEYLSTETELFEKLRATSTCGPFSTEAIEID
jgi:predicted patatin/cPLA2 family phospholipase